MIATPLEVVNISAVISVQIEPNLNSCFKRPAFNGYNFHLEICPQIFVQQTFDIFNTAAESNINPLRIQFTCFQTSKNLYSSFYSVFDSKSKLVQLQLPLSLAQLSPGLFLSNVTLVQMIQISSLTSMASKGFSVSNFT